MSDDFSDNDNNIGVQMRIFIFKSENKALGEKTTLCFLVDAPRH